VSRKPNLTLPRCPDHPGSVVRAEGQYGSPPRPRLRCFHVGADGKSRKHGFRPSSTQSKAWGALPGGRYSITDIANALVDVARGSSYTDAARRVQLAGARTRNANADVEPSAVDGRLVATWVDRFAEPVAARYAEKSWPQTVVLDSTEFTWTNPFSGGRVQLFTVLAAWGYPAGAKRGRLWALRAAPTDNADAWKNLLSSLPGEPELVVYDSDKAVAAAVPTAWPLADIHLCEHHLYVNATKHLLKDGQKGWGNMYLALLADAGHSATGWSVFRNAVLAAPCLIETGAWVTYWDNQMTGQTARRASMPAHYSTGALDPHIAVVRQVLAPRAWTYRNLSRMNALLGLIRLRVNLCDAPGEWAQLIATHLDDRSAPASFDEPVETATDGSRVYSLRKHSVPDRSVIAVVSRGPGQ